VFNVSINVLSFISVGCSVVVAQQLGAGNRNLARKAIHIAIAVNLLLGFMVALTVCHFSGDILRLLNTPESLFADAHDYLYILGICLFPEAVSLIFAACLRVYGKVRAAMYVTLIANTITVLGNMVALYGFGSLEPTGLYGVACSTLVGRLVAIVVLGALIVFGLKLQFTFMLFFQWNVSLLKRILAIGLPSAGENLLWIGQYVVIFGFIGLMGEAELAAQTLYFQFTFFIMALGISISVANEIMVGYHVGAKRYDEAYRRTFRSLFTGLVFTVVLVSLIWVTKMPILDFFANDATTTALLLPLFTLSWIIEPGRTLNIVMVNALRAASDARFPLYMGIIFMWGVSVPVAYILGIVFGWGLIGIWIGFLCDEWLRGLANSWRWKSRKWENKTRGT
jgi:putative MATE family efflux protein